MRWLVVVLIMASGVIAQTPPPDIAAQANRLLGSPAFTVGDVASGLDRADTVRQVDRLILAEDPLARHLRAKWSSDVVAGMSRLTETGDPEYLLPQKLADALNAVVETNIALYEPGRFTGVTLSAETRALLAEKPTGERLRLMHRRLLEDYLGEAVGRYQPPRYTGIGREWGRAVYRFKSSAGTATFDQGSGQLASLSVTPSSVAPEPIGLSAAGELASHWLSDHGISVGEWTRASAAENGSGAHCQYHLDWLRYNGEGVMLPAQLSLILDASGAVVAVQHVDQPVEVSLSPRIPRDEATGRALKAADGSPAELDRVLLRVWIEPVSGAQSLVWSVLLNRDYGRLYGPLKVIVRVDAQTGEVLTVSEPDVALPPGAGASPRKRRLAQAITLAAAVILAVALALRRRRRV